MSTRLSAKERTKFTNARHHAETLLQKHFNVSYLTLNFVLHKIYIYFVLHINNSEQLVTIVNISGRKLRGGGEVGGGGSSKNIT